MSHQRGSTLEAAEVLPQIRFLYSACVVVADDDISGGKEMSVMWKQPENDQFADELFLAGERVPSGVYKQIGGGGREVKLDREDFLPASLDGRVACYMRVNKMWSQLSQNRAA